jgi:hypothetical protein
MWLSTTMDSTRGKRYKEVYQSYKYNKDYKNTLPHKWTFTNSHKQFYSIIYYNSEVWMLNNLNLNLLKPTSTDKQANSNCVQYVKTCFFALQTDNDQIPLNIWAQLNFNQYLTSRQTFFHHKHPLFNSYW